MKVCTKCGTRNDYTAVRCVTCGNPEFIADVGGYDNNANYNNPYGNNSYDNNSYANNGYGNNYAAYNNNAYTDNPGNAGGYNGYPENYGNGSFNGYTNNNNNNNGKIKNLLIGILAVIAVISVAVLCLVAFSGKDDDSSDNKSNRYSSSYSDDYEEEEDEEEEEYEEEEEETEETEKRTETTRESTSRATTTRVIAPEPGNDKQTGEVAIGSELRYSLNLFLSNFSEANLKSFSKRPSDDELVKFAVNYNIINHSDRWERGEWSVNGQSYESRIEEDYIHSSMDDHFTCSIDSSIGTSRRDYSNGYFYATRTGGLVEGDISIVTYLEYVGNDVYCVRFNTYFTGGSNSDYYRSDEYGMSSANYTGSGSAYMVASDINNYYTYYLDSYSV